MSNDAISDFEQWFESLPEDDANELASCMDETICRSNTGERAIEGFESFLVEHLMANPKAFFAPLSASHMKL
jgi:hypothetical protein